MEFEWDTAKSDRCLTERGFDFDYASQVFSEKDLYIKRSSYPDRIRYLAYGMIDNRVLAVVFTMRGTYYRIISARRAKPKEIRDYDYHQNQG